MVQVLDDLKSKRKMKKAISMILAVMFCTAGFTESRQADKMLDEYFKRKLVDVEMCLEVEDGELCLRFYHEMLERGYRLTGGDKANIEQAFEICKKDYKMKLERAVQDPRFKEEDVRKWWEGVLTIYNDLTGKSVVVEDKSR